MENLHFDDVPEVELKVLSATFDSDEACKAFKEKRKPKWTGR